MSDSSAIPEAVKPGGTVIRLNKAELPLTVEYDQQTYVLVRTKSNKLLLQKPLN